MAASGWPYRGRLDLWGLYYSRGECRKYLLEIFFKLVVEGDQSALENLQPLPSEEAGVSIERFVCGIDDRPRTFLVRLECGEHFATGFRICTRQRISNNKHIVSFDELF